MLVPVIESLLDIIYAWIEVAKTKPASIVSKWNKKIVSESVDEEVSAIGFQVQSDDEYEDD